LRRHTFNTSLKKLKTGAGQGKKTWRKSSGTLEGDVAGVRTRKIWKRVVKPGKKTGRVGEKVFIVEKNMKTAHAAPPRRTWIEKRKERG